jgi:hypothetical protein
MKKVVISQPMFFPWVGLFEQIRLADVYIHYDDVQFPQGRSFTNRVQIKTPKGSEWLTVPVIKSGKGLQLIHDVLMDDEQKWREKQVKAFKINYAKAPFLSDALGIMQETYNIKTKYLCEMNIAAIESVSNYFGISTTFMRSSDYKTDLTSSEHLLGLIKQVEGNVYITGHGAKNYLNHELFEKNQIRVEYMDYQRVPYPQLYNGFNPHVSILDLIANMGRDGINVICSATQFWKEFLQ